MYDILSSNARKATETKKDEEMEEDADEFALSPDHKSTSGRGQGLKCVTESDQPAEQLRQLMRLMTHPAVICTATHPRQHGEPRKWRAMTVSSFTSVSLDPPIVSFNMALPSKTFDAIKIDRRFHIHVLAANGYGATLADAFTQGNTEKTVEQICKEVDAAGCYTSPRPSLNGGPPTIRSEAVYYEVRCKVPDRPTRGFIRIANDSRVIVLGEVVAIRRMHQTEHLLGSQSYALTYTDGNYRTEGAPMLPRKRFETELEWLDHQLAGIECTGKRVLMRNRLRHRMAKLRKDMGLTGWPDEIWKDRLEREQRIKAKEVLAELAKMRMQYYERKLAGREKRIEVRIKRHATRIKPRKVFVEPKEQPVIPRKVFVKPKERPIIPRKIFVKPKERPVNPRKIFVKPKERPVIPRTIFVGRKERAVNPRKVFVGRTERPVNPRKVFVGPKRRQLRWRMMEYLARMRAMREKAAQGKESPVNPRKVFVGRKKRRVHARRISVGPTRRHIRWRMMEYWARMRAMWQKDAQEQESTAPAQEKSKSVEEKPVEEKPVEEKEPVEELPPKRKRPIRHSIYAFGRKVQ